jgi:hypothetical protein
LRQMHDMGVNSPEWMDHDQAAARTGESHCMLLALGTMHPEQLGTAEEAIPVDGPLNLSAWTGRVTVGEGCWNQPEALCLTKP